MIAVLQLEFGKGQFERVVPFDILIVLFTLDYFGTVFVCAYTCFSKAKLF